MRKRPTEEPLLPRRSIHKSGKAGPHAALPREVAVPSGRVVHARPGTAAKRSGVQRRLFLRRGERPRGARAALLAKDETQLLRRRKLRLVRPEGGAGLSQLQCTQQVAPEIAL